MGGSQEEICVFEVSLVSFVRLVDKQFSAVNYRLIVDRGDSTGRTRFFQEGFPLDVPQVFWFHQTWTWMWFPG